MTNCGGHKKYQKDQQARTYVPTSELDKDTSTETLTSKNEYIY